MLLSDANLCNPSVLDRLNSLMEENGTLAVGEKGCRNGQIPQVVPNSNFRMFLTMDPRDGDLSPAMRNRGVEICTGKFNQEFEFSHQKKFCIFRYLNRKCAAKGFAVLDFFLKLSFFNENSSGNELVGNLNCLKYC